MFNRHHPSVIAWSLANESPWSPVFTLSLNTYIKPLDSSRPFMFDGGSGQTMRVQGGELDIETVHYPSGGSFSPVPYPVSFGEYVRSTPSQSRGRFNVYFAWDAAVCERAFLNLACDCNVILLMYAAYLQHVSTLIVAGMTPPSHMQPPPLCRSVALLLSLSVSLSFCLCLYVSVSVSLSLSLSRFRSLWVSCSLASTIIP